MPSLDGHTLIRRSDGLGDLDIAIGGLEVHILGGTDLALDENHILRIEGNLSFGGGDVALGSDVTPGLDGQVALGADIAVLDNLHILAGNKLATSVSRNRALDNQVALGGGDCDSTRADSAVDEGVVLRFYNRNAGFEGAFDRRIPASAEFECVSGGDGFVGNDVTLLGIHGDHCRAGFPIEGDVVLCHDIHDTKPIRCELGKLGITTRLDPHVSYRGCDVGGGLDIAGRRLDGNSGAFNCAIDNHIAHGGSDFDAIRADSAIENRIVLRGDGQVASMGREPREGRVTASSDGDVAVVRGDVAAHRHIMPGLDGDVASGCRHGYLGVSGHAAVQRGYGDILAAEALRVALAKADIIECENLEVAARGDAFTVEADGIQGTKFDIAGGGDFTMVPKFPQGLDGDIALLRNDVVNRVIEIESGLNIDVLLGGDSTLAEINIPLRLNAHATLDGSERVEVGVTTSRGHDVAGIGDDGFSGEDIAARGDGCATGSDGALHNDISPVSGEGELAASLDSPVECRIVLCGDGHVAIYGGEFLESCVTASINDDIAGIRGDVSRGVDIPAAPDVDQGLGRDEILVNHHIPAGEDEQAGVGCGKGSDNGHIAGIGGEVDVAGLHVLACGIDVMLGIQHKLSGHIQVGGAQEDIVLEGGDIQGAECGFASIDEELHTLGGGDVKPAGICQSRVRNDRDIPQRLDTGKVPDYQVAALELDVIRIVEVDVIQKAQIPLGLETQPEGAANHDLFQIFTLTPCECDVACPAAA